MDIPSEFCLVTVSSEFDVDQIRTVFLPLEKLVPQSSVGIFVTDKNVTESSATFTVTIRHGTSLSFIRREELKRKIAIIRKESIPSYKILQIVELRKNLVDRIIDFLLDGKVFTFVNKSHGNGINRRQKKKNQNSELEKSHAAKVRNRREIFRHKTRDFNPMLKLPIEKITKNSTRNGCCFLLKIL